MYTRDNSVLDAVGCMDNNPWWVIVVWCDVLNEQDYSLLCLDLNSNLVDYHENEMN